MKKLVVLVATALLFATPALALIAGSKHDLSTAGPVYSSDTDETCVFCHTPHQAAVSSFAPLWNRGFTNATAVYGNPAGTMDATPTLVSVNASDATLCLSCHDGAGYTAALVNPPNSLGGAQPTVTLTGVASAGANLGTDLSNDHPIGFDYTTATATDTELELKAAVEAVGGMAQALSYGAGNDMWCSSCHDVHGVAGVPTFLRMDNAASALCTTCHIK